MVQKIGLVSFMIVPGILALAGVPVELKFFGIEVDTQRERAIWTVVPFFGSCRLCHFAQGEGR